MKEGAPIYLKIKRLLLKEIQKKVANSAISSERELAVQYDVSRMTVRKAVDELVDEGVLYRNGNRGTFVAARSMIKKNTAMDVILAKDTSYTMIYFNIKSIPEIAKILGVQEDEAILRIVRVNHVEEKVLSVEEIYYVRNLISDEEINNLKVLLDLNLYVERGSITQKFIPALVPLQYTNQMKIAANTPIIIVESLIRSMEGIPLIYVKAYNNPYENVIEIVY